MNIKMENNSSGKKKKGVSWVVDKFLNLFLIACGVVVIWILLQVTSIATFKIPSDSMEPALLAGDNILVNKWVMGGRIFNIWDALEGKEVKISRLPGLGKIRRNDVLVFNFPYPAQWDSIGLNVMSYYVKRCVALPGDTFETKCRITRAKHPFYFAEGEGYVGDTLCVKAEFSFGITEKAICFQRS